MNQTHDPGLIHGRCKNAHILSVSFRKRLRGDFSLPHCGTRILKLCICTCLCVTNGHRLQPLEVMLLCVNFCQRGGVKGATKKRTLLCNVDNCPSFANAFSVDLRRDWQHCRLVNGWSSCVAFSSRLERATVRFFSRIKLYDGRILHCES